MHDTMKVGRTYLLMMCITILHLSTGSVNLSRGKPTNQSSTYQTGTWTSDLAVDGCRQQRVSTSCCMHTSTDQGQREAWWRVDLQEELVVENVLIYYRDGWVHRLGGYAIILSNASDWRQGDRCYTDESPSKCSLPSIQNNTCQGITQYLTVYVDRRVKLRDWYSTVAILELCEVEVYGCPVGKYGNGNCNSFCDVSCNGICRPSTGVCLRCGPGSFKNGGRCSACPQQCLGGCDMETGACTECPDGAFGDFCEACPSACDGGHCAKDGGSCTKGCVTGNFGVHCNMTCPVNCRTHVCEQMAGTCAGCEPGKYGFTCKESCPGCCRGRPCLQVDGTCEELPITTSKDDCSVLKVVFPVTLAFVIAVCVLIMIGIKQRYAEVSNPTKQKALFFDNKVTMELEQPTVYSSSSADD